jgi:hypothetical protein
VYCQIFFVGKPPLHRFAFETIMGYIIRVLKNDFEYSGVNGG